jgi:hypothetical protein
MTKKLPERLAAKSLTSFVARFINQELAEERRMEKEFKQEWDKWGKRNTNRKN